MKAKEQELNLPGLDASPETDIGLETVLFWMERARHIAEREGDLPLLMKSIKSVLRADLLLLDICQDGAIVRYSDFRVPAALQKSMCLPGGLYDRLARIRFTHLFDSRSPVSVSLAVDGQPTLEILAAVPVIRKDRPAGCLVAGFTASQSFTPGCIMLLAVAAELISITDNLFRPTLHPLKSY